MLNWYCFIASDPLMADSHRTRLLLFGVLVLGLFGALVARLWYLQVLTPETYQIQAQANLIREEPIPAPRGRILDRNGNPLVDNRLTNAVTIDKFALEEALPNETDKRELAVRLAREISQTGRLTKAEAIQSAINDPKYGPFSVIPIATDVSEEFSILLGERLSEFPGVDVEPATVRHYPYGNVAAHVLGRLGPISDAELAQRELHAKNYGPNDEIGKEGIERSFEDILRGTPGFRQIEVDAFNNLIEVREDIAPIPGSDIMLTIDVDLQVMVERELQAGLERARLREVTGFDAENKVSFGTGEFFPAEAGAAVVMDPRNGAVLAMASYPTFDPQLFIGGISNNDWEQLQDPNEHTPLLNRPLQGLYSPGSTFKPVTSYAALDTGLLSDRGVYPMTEFVPDPGIFRIPDCEFDDCVFTNARSQVNGNVDLRDAIIVSSDVYFYKLGYELAARRGFDEASIQNAANQFGLGSVTGIALPGEQAGLVPTRELMYQLYQDQPEVFPFGNDWTYGDTINISIGQGDLTATPLQMANAYAVLANGGTLFQPKIAEAEIDAITDEIIRPFHPRVVDQLYFPATWRDTIIEGLRGVVAATEEPLQGTAIKAFENFPLDRWPMAGKTGTVERLGKKDSAAFIGFGPLPAPEYVMFVYAEEGGFGGDTAAPIVRNVFEAIANDDVDTVFTVEQREDLDRQFRPGIDEPEEPAEGVELPDEAPTDETLTVPSESAPADTAQDATAPDATAQDTTAQDTAAQGTTATDGASP